MRDEKNSKEKMERFVSTEPPNLSNVVKRRKKRFVVIVILFLLVIAAGAVAFIPTGLEEYRSKKNIEKTVTEFLVRYSSCDPSASELLAGTEDVEMNYEGISKYFANNLKYKIESVNQDSDDVFTVEIRAETIDFEKIFTDSYQNAVEQYGEQKAAENVLSIMQQKCEEGKYETKAITAESTVLKINGTFKIQMNSALANALSGGMNDYLISLEGGE